MPKEFATAQAQDPPAFYFNRPPEAAPIIPVTLYHSTFGQFKDDCKNYQPTKDDNNFVFRFSSAMCRFYDSGAQRAERAREELASYGLGFSISTTDNPYQTDRDPHDRGFCYAIFEIKPEMCSTSVEPLFQATWYYVAFTEKLVKMEKDIRSHLDPVSRW